MRFISEDLHRVFFRSRDEQAETVEQAAGADTHRFGWNSLERNRFDEICRRGSGLEPVGNCGKGVLVGGHECTSCEEYFELKQAKRAALNLFHVIAGAWRLRKSLNSAAISPAFSSHSSRGLSGSS